MFQHHTRMFNWGMNVWVDVGGPKLGYSLGCQEHCCSLLHFPASAPLPQPLQLASQLR